MVLHSKCTGCPRGDGVRFAMRITHGFTMSRGDGVSSCPTGGPELLTQCDRVTRTLRRLGKSKKLEKLGCDLLICNVEAR
jgi:hypothetical protein